MDFQSGKDECKKFEKNNLTIALNVLYAKNDIQRIFQNKIENVKNKLFN